MWPRRAFCSTLAAAACGSGLPAGAGPVNSLNLSGIPLPVHEQAMQLAIAEAHANPVFPFGAVLVRAADRQVMARGVNDGVPTRLCMAKSSP